MDPNQSWYSGQSQYDQARPVQYQPHTTAQTSSQSQYHQQSNGTSVQMTPGLGYNYSSQPTHPTPSQRYLPEIAVPQYSQSRYYNTSDNYASHQSMPSSSPPNNFIPTPGELMASNSQLPHPIGPSSPYKTTFPVRNHSRAPSSFPTTVTGDSRYLCDFSGCTKTFSRLHDMRRHYDTAHSAAARHPRCQYCTKEFSRPDSLKRHIDNGCQCATDKS